MIEKQLGPLIMAMHALDPSIALSGEAPPPPEIPNVLPPNERKPSGSVVLKILKFLFLKPRRPCAL